MKRIWFLLVLLSLMITSPTYAEDVKGCVFVPTDIVMANEGATVYDYWHKVLNGEQRKNFFGFFRSIQVDLEHFYFGLEPEKTLDDPYELYLAVTMYIAGKNKYKPEVFENLPIGPWVLPAAPRKGLSPDAWDGTGNCPTVPFVLTGHTVRYFNEEHEGFWLGGKVAQAPVLPKVDPVGRFMKAFAEATPRNAEALEAKENIAPLAEPIVTPTDIPVVEKKVLEKIRQPEPVPVSGFPFWWIPWLIIVVLLAGIIIVLVVMLAKTKKNRVKPQPRDDHGNFMKVDNKK